MEGLKISSIDRLARVFETGKGVYMAHVYYGDPSSEFSQRLIQTLITNGVDIIEFGIPFSDPTADGPVFQRACYRALQNGMTPAKALRGIRLIREANKTVPIVVTTYYNIVFTRGTDTFLAQISEAGADALLIPDIPLEESSELLSRSKEHDIHLIQMISPRTSDSRMQKIMAQARGFVYATAVPGVTGVRERVQDETLSFVKRTTQYYDIPILVGFGISRPEHVTPIIGAGARGVVTGSAVCKIYERQLDDPDAALGEIGNFVASISQACSQS